MKLAIISHTGHFKDAEGGYVGWGPTVQELNHLAPHLTEIVHVAFLHEGTPPPSALPYTQDNIRFVALPPQGGKTWGAKLSLLWNLPKTIGRVRKILREVDAFQLRTPTGMGTYLIPYLSLFSKKKGWYKYAGNWNQEHAPLGYSLQRWMLKKQKRTVTINGRWEDQPHHCLTFENPCLTHTERELGKQIIAQKNYEGPFTYCFVGRLEDGKGVQRILEALALLEDLSGISAVHFIGDGEKKNDYVGFAKRHALPVHFHGFLQRDKVFDIYKESHFLLLPSTASEGFPKVIAEGMNFGCIPMVSKVSSIAQYINPSNGYPLAPTTSEALKATMGQAFIATAAHHKAKAVAAHEIAEKFTFERYNDRIINEILKGTS